MFTSVLSQMASLLFSIQSSWILTGAVLRTISPSTKGSLDLFVGFRLGLCYAQDWFGLIYSAVTEPPCPLQKAMGEMKIFLTSSDELTASISKSNHRQFENCRLGSPFSSSSSPNASPAFAFFPGFAFGVPIDSGTLIKYCKILQQAAWYHHSSGLHVLYAQALPFAISRFNLIFKKLVYLWGKKWTRF